MGRQFLNVRQKMENLYTFVVTCSDGSEDASQERGATLGEALDRWARNTKPEGFIDSLTLQEREEVARDFSLANPTCFSEPVELSEVENVWRVSTALQSGKALIVTCVLSYQKPNKAEKPTPHRW